MGDTTHFGIHIYGHPKEIGFAHLSWLMDAAELPQSLALAESGELPSGWDQESGPPGVKYKGDWDSRPHPARVIRVDYELLARLAASNWRAEDAPVEQTQAAVPGQH